MALQAEARRIKHLTMDVDTPHLETYKNNIRRLKDEFGTTLLATGDMMDVSQGFMPRVVRELESSPSRLNGRRTGNRS
jgi:hypothetical protein